MQNFWLQFAINTLMAALAAAIKNPKGNRARQILSTLDEIKTEIQNFEDAVSRSS